jgi:RimJ/RimL family protein N-acetyltransferase
VLTTQLGHGYATESAIGWRDYGFLKLDKQRLVSIIQFENRPSIRVALKNGMEYEREIVFKEKRVALYSVGRHALHVSST